MTTGMATGMKTRAGTGILTATIMVTAIPMASADITTAL